MAKKELSKRDIDISIVCNENLQIKMDATQIEQVVINLVKNSMDALNAVEGKGEIVREGISKNEQASIIVGDNGPGIEAEDLKNIWVPFFTTKETGLGMGLSLARQIMALHHGKI